MISCDQILSMILSLPYSFHEVWRLEKDQLMLSGYSEETKNPSNISFLNIGVLNMSLVFGRLGERSPHF